jgi:hypothetical protein
MPARPFRLCPELDISYRPAARAETPQFRGIGAVAAQKAVHFARSPVSRLAGIKQDDAAAATAEHQCRAQASRAPSDDDHINGHDTYHGWRPAHA